MKHPCEECGKPTEERCPLCNAYVCHPCLEDHVDSHGDVEDLHEKPKQLEGDLIEVSAEDLEGGPVEVSAEDLDPV